MILYHLNDAQRAFISSWLEDSPDRPAHPIPTMILYHLNDAQRAFISSWLEDNPVRPPFNAYDKSSRLIAKIPVARKPTVKAVPYANPGFGGNELVPKKPFDATLHLPVGWAVVSCHDSGGNHKFENAGTALLRALWNCWSSKSGAAIDFTTPLGSKLQRQLTANNISFP